MNDEFQSNAVTVAQKAVDVSGESDSGTLRALLTNKRLRYSPSYASSSEKRKTDIVTLSPIKTDERLDLFEDFPHAIRQAIGVGSVSRRNGCETISAMHSPSTMTSENVMTSQIQQSPMSNYVEGISTPPLSPKEASATEQQTHVTQMSANMIDDEWTNTSSERK